MGNLLGSITHALATIAFSPVGLIAALVIGGAGGFVAGRTWEA